MIEKIKKSGNIVTITKTFVEEVDINQLKNELDLLKNEPEPTVEQLIEAAKTNTPVFYYSPERQLKISELESKIAELEAL